MSALIGHEKIMKDLATLADRGALPHAVLFYGPAMTGKRTVAWGLARYLEKGGGDIKEFVPPAEGEVLQDAKIVDLEFAKQLDPDRKDSVSIDAVREIKNFLWQKPVASARRMLILDEAEFLTTDAQNALLKLIEEPPASALVVLIAADPDALLPTVNSRLEKLYFGAVPEAAIAKWLAAEHGLAAAKAAPLAKRSLGKPGLALRLHSDETLKENLKLAEAYLKTPAAGRRDFIKKLLTPEDFNLRVFLEAVIIVLVWAMEKPTAGRIALWHKTLALYGRVMEFGLNPRLQLMALLAAE